MILKIIQPIVIELFGNLNSFNKNKMGIEALLVTLVPPGVLEAIEVKAVGLYKGGDHMQIKVEFYQRQLDGKSPITNADEIYAVAARVPPLFQKMLVETKIACRGSNLG